MKLTNSLLKEETLMSELGLTDFDKKQQQDLFAIMMDILEVKVLDAVLSELSEAEQKEFTLTLLGENTDAAKDYLNKKIKNLDDKLNKVVQEFRAELLQDVLQAKKDLLKK